MRDLKLKFVIDSMTILSRSLVCISILWTSPLWIESPEAQAKTLVMNGGSCVPFPRYGYDLSVNVYHYLTGFSSIAHCHFTLDDEMRAVDLKYVLVHAVVTNDSELRSRLCTYNVGSTNVSCGAERTIPSNGSIEVLYPPYPNDSADGAFVQLIFRGVSHVTSLVSVFDDPSDFSPPFATPEQLIQHYEELELKASEAEEAQRIAILSEGRDTVWAARQEKSLHETFVQGPQRLAIEWEEGECRSTRCSVRLKLDKTTETKAAQQLASIEQWISTVQKCGFTLVHDHKKPVVSVFTRCKADEDTRIDTKSNR